jgi:hypothetical protein
MRRLLGLEKILSEYFYDFTEIDVGFLVRVALAVFWLGATIILLYENFKNGTPPEPAWWVAFETAIGGSVSQ